MPERYNGQFWNHLDLLVNRTRVVIDRPRHTVHPTYSEMIYPVDYGYLAGTVSSDGAGIDVFLGTDGKHDVRGVICTVDLVKHDTEMKLLLGCSEQEITDIVDFLNDSEGMHCYFVRREPEAKSE
jgi:inorganic pyrophosphatase